MKLIRGFSMCVLAVLGGLGTLPVLAEENKPAPAESSAAAKQKLNSTVLGEVLVSAEANYQGLVQPVFPPPVQGAKIYSGKKASVINFDAQPQIVGNDYRQAFAGTPGILLSEETSPLVSLGYRGIGEPHRAQFFNVLKDGIPIHADPLGYPEAYYTPALDVVDRLEFIRGGASLMYMAPSQLVRSITSLTCRSLTARSPSAPSMYSARMIFTALTLPSMERSAAWATWATSTTAPAKASATATASMNSTAAQSKWCSMPRPTPAGY